MTERFDPADELLLIEARRLIAELRNRRDVPGNWVAFRRLIESRRQDVIRAFSLRWLVSVCDTFADFGSEIERRDALLVSMFLNMLRLAEVVRFVRPQVDPSQLAAARGNPIELYDGVCTFSIDQQDTFLNLGKRAERQLGDSLMGDIWREIVRRVLEHDTAVAEFRELSARPERYFPADPLSQADNYGVV